jgi:hypothetical protein
MTSIIEGRWKKMKLPIRHAGGLSITCLLILSFLLVVISPCLSFAFTIGIEAHIDGRDQLIINRDTLQWHHFDYAAVGRHLGANSPTIISSDNSQWNWIPEWPEEPPAEIRYEAYSTVFEHSLFEFPTDGQPWSINHLFGRGETSIVQQPSNINDYTLVIEFDDNPFSGSRFYGIELQPSPVPEPATLFLLGCGLLSMAGYHRKKQKK